MAKGIALHAAVALSFFAGDRRATPRPG
jgi:hypothetical protein